MIFLKLFIIFTKIGTFNFGGGYAMLSLMTHRDSKVVKSVFAGLRPAIVGLIAAASLLLMTKDNFGSPKDEPIGFGISVALFAVTFFLTRYRKTNPILVMLCCGLLGLLVF